MPWALQTPLSHPVSFCVRQKSCCCQERHNVLSFHDWQPAGLDIFMRIFQSGIDRCTCFDGLRGKGHDMDHWRWTGAHTLLDCLSCTPTSPSSASSKRPVLCSPGRSSPGGARLPGLICCLPGPEPLPCPAPLPCMPLPGIRLSPGPKACSKHASSSTPYLVEVHRPEGCFAEQKSGGCKQYVQHSKPGLGDKIPTASAPNLYVGCIPLVLVEAWAADSPAPVPAAWEGAGPGQAQVDPVWSGFSLADASESYEHVYSTQLL